MLTIRRVLGAFLLAGGTALMGRPVTGPPAPLLLHGLLVLVVLGTGAYILQLPWLTLLIVGGGGILVARFSPAIPPLVGVLTLTLYSLLLTVLGGRRRGVGLQPADGFIAVGLMVLLSLSLSMLAPVPPPGPQFHRVSVLLVLYLLTPPLEMLTALVVLLHARELGPFVRRNYSRQPGLGSGLAMGFLLGIAAIMLVAATVAAESALFHLPIKPNNPFVYTPHLSNASWPVIAGMLLAVVVMAPLAEEALFRGLLYGGLARLWGMWPAVLVSALIFGGAHMNLSLFLPLALGGVILALIYAKSGSLWPSTVAHATLNGISVLMALLVR